MKYVTSGAGRELWEQSDGVNYNEIHLLHSLVSSPTEELRKDKRRNNTVQDERGPM